MKKYLHASFAILAIVSLFSSIATATVFSGRDTGPISDAGPGTPPNCSSTAREVNFDVTGMRAPIAGVSVDFTMYPEHTWIGDLQVSLIAPDLTSFTIFSRVGQQDETGDNGDSSRLSGTYTFTDAATNNIWTAAAAGGGSYLIPEGAYRTQLSGPFGNDGVGPAETTLNTAFTGVANPNGVWTLRFMDCAQADTGSVVAANLTLLSPTAGDAMLMGHVVNAYGSGIRGAKVTISGGNLVSRNTVTTNTFGIFQFSVPAGQMYFVNARAPRNVFEVPTRAVYLDGDLTGFDFVAAE
jgi:subtilisin-like proprotein convertase family protein